MMMVPTNANEPKMPNWRFAMEQIGRELRKVYPPSKRVPPGFRTLFAQLEDKSTKSERQRRRNNTGGGD